jgi:putative aldouronate transport system substrate-binding protein
MSNSRELSRRSLLAAMGLGAAAVTAPTLLAGCGKGSSDSVGNAGTKQVAWPAYQPFAGPTPDLPGTAAGVQAGYTKYPTNLVTSVKAKPGDGSKVRAVCITYGTPPKPVEQNKLWQALNAALGIDLQLTFVADADFDAKMATLIAGNDLPDIICVGGGHALPREQQFISTKCADLSDFVSGDKIKDYPNLANIPTYSWQGMGGRAKGRIFGVPQERPLPSTAMFLNRDAFTTAGADYAAWTKADFAAAVKALSKNKQFGLGANKASPFGLRQYLAGCFGAVNDWGVEGGQFIRSETQPQFKEALAFARELYTAGSFYPDSASISTVDMKTFFYNGTIKGMADGLAAFQDAVTSVKGAFTVDMAMPFQGGSGPGTIQAGSGAFGYAALKQAPAERIQMLLRVLDYLAAPFGSKEYELTHFGVEGVHFTRDSAGTPQPTPLWSGGENIVNLPVRYIAEAPRVLYFAGVDAESVKRMHAWQTKAVPVALKNPATGLISDTGSRSGVTLNLTLVDGMNAIVTGREPLTSWDAVIKKWRADGGDKVAQEYAKEFAG